MVGRQIIRTGFFGLIVASLALSGCAAPATTANTEKSLWQRMAWWRESAPPTMGPSTNAPVRIAESSGPSKLKNPVKLNLAYGRWQEQIGQFSEARHAYDAVLKEEPKSVDAILGLARLDLLAGRVREAEAGFERAVSLKPNDAYATAALGEFYTSQERWPDAVRTLQTALSQAKTDVSVSPSDKVKIEYELALAMARSGDIPGSLPHFASSVGEAEGHYNIGHLLYEKGQMAAAAQQFEQALRLQPNLHEAQQLLDEIRRPASGMQLTSGVKTSAARVENTHAYTAAHSAGIASTQSAGAAPYSTRLPVASQFTAPRPTGSSASSVNPPTPPANMTPQQREQWENQFGRSAATAIP